MSDQAASERRLGREAVIGFGLVGSAALLFADVMVRAGSLEYTHGDIDGPLHTTAFLTVLALAAAGMLGVWLARSRSGLATWLLRAAAAGSLVASLNAVLRPAIPAARRARPVLLLRHAAAARGVGRRLGRARAARLGLGLEPGRGVALVDRAGAVA